MVDPQNQTDVRARQQSPYYRTRVRTARRPRQCDDYTCTHIIQPGERYLVHTEFPGGDAGFADHAGHPVRMGECRLSVAQRRGEDYAAEMLGTDEVTR